MRFISWNVNGLRACMQKGFADYFAALNADFFCLQETKLQPEQISIDFPGYLQFWNSAIPARPSLQSTHRFPLLMAWALTASTTRGG